MRLATFDVYPKTLSEFRQRTLTGAAVSIACTLLIAVLTVIEVADYLQVRQDDHLFVDTSRGQQLRINLNVTFPALPCSVLSLDTLDVSGNHAANIMQNIHKVRLDADGRRMPEDEPRAKAARQVAEAQKTVAQKVAEAAQAQAQAQGTGPTGRRLLGAPHQDEQPEEEADEEEEDEEHRRRQRRAAPGSAGQRRAASGIGELRAGRGAGGGRPAGGLAGGREMSLKELLQGGPLVGSAFGGGDTLLSKLLSELLPGVFEDKEAVEELRKHVGEGCHLEGFMQVNKVAGNFHFALQKADHHVLMTVFGKREAINVSHHIHSVSFGEPYRGMVNPLDNQPKIVHEGSGYFQYYLKVVPTIYEYAGRPPLLTNQYSYTELFRTTHELDKLPAVFFHYDISPIMAKVTEGRRSLSTFLTGLCAIVGGVFTVAGMLDSCLFRLGKLSGSP